MRPNPRQCRSARRAHDTGECPECGGLFVRTFDGQRFCGVECNHDHALRNEGPAMCDLDLIDGEPTLA